MAFNRDRPIRFHPHCGNNIELSKDNTVAERKSSFRNAITFSETPLKPGELFLIQIDGISEKWSGYLRFGLTQEDPNSYFPLPKYVSPDLTNTAGTWATSVQGSHIFTGTDAFEKIGSLVKTPKGLLRRGDLLPFGYGEQKGRDLGFQKETWKAGDLGSRIGVILIPVDSDFADIHFIINGVDVPFRYGIPYAENDLYVIIDIYGCTTKVRIVDYIFREDELLQSLSGDVVRGSLRTKDISSLGVSKYLQDYICLF